VPSTKKKSPLPSTVAVPSTTPLASLTVTSVLASAFPVNRVPRLITSRLNGAPGAVKSGDRMVEGPDGLVLASARVTLSCCPVSCGGVRAIVKVPSLPTTPVPTGVLLASMTVTVLPGSPVPVRRAPLVVIARAPGAAGGVVSMALKPTTTD
jgi:hypothetical protein